MLITLALLIFVAAIMVFFSQEFIRTIKKLFTIKGAKLLLPLFLASWLIYTFEGWALWIVYYYSEVLHAALLLLMRMLPFHQGAQSAALILLLSLVSIVPVLVMDVISHRNTYRPYPYPYVTSGIIWIISAVLLTVL